MRNPADQLEQLLAPVFDSTEVAKAKVIATGLPAGPGAASGQIYLNADRAVVAADKGEKVLLVRDRDLARGSARHDRGRRHPHRARRRVVARGAGRPADGQGLRLRRGGGRSRLPGADGEGRRADLQGRRLDVDRRHDRQGLRRPGQDRAVGDRRRPDRRRRGGQEDREVQQLPAADEVVLGRDAHESSAPTPTRRSRPRTPSRSAPSASASPAPSTCSSRATASTRCAR